MEPYQNRETLVSRQVSMPDPDVGFLIVDVPAGYRFILTSITISADAISTGALFVIGSTNPVVTGTWGVTLRDAGASRHCTYSPGFDLGTGSIYIQRPSVDSTNGLAIITGYLVRA